MTTMARFSSTSDVDVPLRRIYLVRAALALVWAVIFASSSSRLTGLTMTLLIVYPLIDVAASVADARTHPEAGSSRLQVVNAALSIVAVIAIAITSTHDTSAVLRAFGAWALVSGLIQLAVALGRRSRVGWQWAILVSGAGSTLVGAMLELMAGNHDPSLHNLSRFAGFGAFLFIVSAVLLGRSARAASPTT
jgi:uncharacterized membrane protein HdeD (DUF308 family)